MNLLSQYKVPDTHSRNWRYNFQILAPVFPADARLLMSLTAFGTAPESGIAFRSVTRISGAPVRVLAGVVLS